MLSASIDLTVGKRTSDTTFDRIYKSIFGEVDIKLSPKEEEIKKRWRRAWNQLSSFKKYDSAVKVLVDEFDITERTAYSDIKYAELLYGDPYAGNKEFHRTKVNRMIDALMEKLFEKEDFEGMERLIGRYIKNNNTEIEDHPLAHLLKNMKPTQIILTYDAEVLNKEANKLMEDVEDVNYTDVTNEQSKAS